MTQNTKSQKSTQTNDPDVDQVPVLLTETKENVAYIGLNRPRSLNALNVPLLDALLRALDEAYEAHAVVIYGQGRAFCTGEDRRETLSPQSGTPEELRASFEKLQELTRRMTRLPAPIVIAAQGYAVGGGAELAIAGDLIIAKSDLRIRFPEISIGQAVTGGISGRLPAILGLMRAKELLLTGRWVEAAELHDMGIVTDVVSDPLTRAKELAHMLAHYPKRSMAATKRELELASQSNQETVLNNEIDAALYCFASPEAAASFDAYQDTDQSRGLS